MSRNFDESEVTIEHDVPIEEAFEGIPGHGSHASSDSSDIDDLSVLTGDIAAEFIELASQNPDFEAVKQYCEGRYGAAIDEENARVVEHPYLSANHSAIFISESSNKQIKLSIVVFFEDQSISQTVAFMDLLTNGETKERRVIRHMDDGFTEYIVER